MRAAPFRQLLTRFEWTRPLDVYNIYTMFWPKRMSATFKALDGNKFTNIY